MRSLLYALGDKTLSGGREDAVCRAKNFYAHGEKILCAWREISVRTKIYFRAHKKIFSCAQKFLGFRREISLRRHALSSMARQGLGREALRRPCSRRERRISVLVLGGLAGGE